MASPCISNGPCITLGTTGSPAALTAAPVISPDAGNGLACHGNGMWAPAAPTLVSAGAAFPASPYLGQTVYYDTNEGLSHWAFQYIGGSPYPWAFIGGAPVLLENAGGGSLPSGNVQLTSTYTVPYAAWLQISITGAVRINDTSHWEVGYSTGADFFLPGGGIKGATGMGTGGIFQVACQARFTVAGGVTLSAILKNIGASADTWYSLEAFVQPVAWAG